MWYNLGTSEAAGETQESSTVLTFGMGCVCMCVCVCVGVCVCFHAQRVLLISTYKLSPSGLIEMQHHVVLKTILMTVMCIKMFQLQMTISLTNFSPSSWEEVSLLIYYNLVDSTFVKECSTGLFTP